MVGGTIPSSADLSVVRGDTDDDPRGMGTAASSNVAYHPRQQSLPTDQGVLRVREDADFLATRQSDVGDCIVARVFVVALLQ